MSASVFLDTNVLVYSYSFAELDKQRIARNCISENNSFISTQVLQELCNTLIKKYKSSPSELLLAVNECRNNNLVYVNTESIILKACNIVGNYGFSFYDSLIIASALECNCIALFSEDLNNGQIIEDKLKIVNPFT
jgi:predicted nucleic acid-binding protein